MKKLLKLCSVIAASFILFSCGENNKTSVESEAPVSNVCHHYWELVSDTATCQHDGVATYKCSGCGGTKTEESPRKEHDFYNITNECKWCGKYKYDITVEGGLPCSASYGYLMSSGAINYYSQFEITELSFRTYKYGSNLELYGILNKTYDKKGENGTTLAMFNVKLVSEDNDEILEVLEVVVTNTMVGQKAKFNKRFKLSTKDLSVDKKYRAIIVDYVG